MHSIRSSLSAPPLVSALLFVAVVSVLWLGFSIHGSSVQSAYPSPSKPVSVLQTSTEPTVVDTYRDWQRYTAKNRALSFTYPASWYVHEDAKKQRIYVSNTKTGTAQDAVLGDYQRLWISYNKTEASTAKEQAAQRGAPVGKLVNGTVQSGTLPSGSFTIATYIYNTSGGKTLDAYWSSNAGTRYYATNTTRVGQPSQAAMVKTLQRVLGSVVMH